MTTGTLVPMSHGDLITDPTGLIDGVDTHSEANPTSFSPSLQHIESVKVPSDPHQSGVHSAENTNIFAAHKT